jgi:flagellar assembly protein FliH
MFLSDQTAPPFSSTRVITGGGTVDLPGRVDTRWDDRTEALYMEQVRSRATGKAKELLAQALEEAESIRRQAHEEGFLAGQAEAVAQVQAEAEKVSDFLTSLQQALVAEKERIFHTHKNTLFQILRVALEKTLNVTLEERREEILQSLLEEAVANLQTQTSVTLHVSPQDLPLARELVDQYRAAGPGRPELTIHVDEDLGPGGLRLESGDGMVDNSVASRFEQVRQILDEYQEAP